MPRAFLLGLCMVELSCRWAGKVHAPWLRPGNDGDKRLVADPDPAAAVRELRETGEPARPPTTTLTGDAVTDPLCSSATFATANRTT